MKIRIHLNKEKLGKMLASVQRNLESTPLVIDGTSATKIKFHLASSNNLLLATLHQSTMTKDSGTG